MSSLQQNMHKTESYFCLKIEKVHNPIPEIFIYFVGRN